MTNEVIEASDEVIVLLGKRFDDPQRGAAALAVALGRVCSVAGLSIPAMADLAELARNRQRGTTWE